MQLTHTITIHMTAAILATTNTCCPRIKSHATHTHDR